MSIMAPRKVRADAKLEHLNDAQRERLHFLLEENWSYSEVVRLLREQLGISVGRSAVSAYYRRHMLPLQQQDDAEDVAAFAALPAGDFDAATLQRAKALLWAALASINPDVALAAKLSGIIEKAERHALAVRKLELEERKVALSEERAGARAEAAEKRSGKRHEPSPAAAAISACERPNPPRFPGYSEVGRAEAEAGSETTQRPKGHEKAGEAKRAIGRSDRAGLTAETQSGEGRKEGSEEVKPSESADKLTPLAPPPVVAASQPSSTAEDVLSFESGVPAESGRGAWPAMANDHCASDDAALVAEIANNLDEYEASLEEARGKKDEAELVAKIGHAAYLDLVRYISRPGFSGRRRA